MKQVYHPITHELVEVEASTPVMDYDGKKYLLTPEQQSEFDLRVQAALAEKASYIATLKYKDDRAKMYGSVQDQLDMMYWDGVNGTTTWKTHIATVKATYPKP